MLSIARKLSDTPPPFQAVGTVTARNDGASSPWCVRATSGDYEARRAVSCLVEPAVDDTVLLTVLPTGECYVLAILERPEATATATLTVPGDLHVALPGGRFTVAARESVELAAGREVSIAAGRLNVNAVDGNVVLQKLTLLAGLVRGESESVRVVAATLDSVVGRLTQRLGRSFRTVEESDHLRANHIDYRAKEHLSLHADAAIVSANELVKVDAEQIHLG
jgi:hypothetical protein